MCKPYKLTMLFITHQRYEMFNEIHYKLNKIT